MKIFNMNEIGRKINIKRKEKNLTQVELADKLGVSYQAVSNWERGDSMPDISKLSELSNIFDISIDELLGNSRVTNVIKDIILEKEVDLKEIEKEELNNILPIVKPDQFKKSFKDFKDLDFELLIMLAPFLDEEDIDELVLNNYNKENSVKIVAFAPFMSERAINDLFIKVSQNEDIDKSLLFSFAPFIDEKLLDKEALRLYETMGMSTIIGLAPFMSNDALTSIANKLKVENNYKELMLLVPFLDNLKDTFSNLFKNK